MQVLVAALRVGVFVLAYVRVSGNFVRFGVVVVGHVEGGLFLGISKRLLDVVVDLFVELFGLGIDFFPVGMASVGDVEDRLAGFQLRRDVFHLNAGCSQLLSQKQVAVIQIHVLAFFHQVQTLGLQRVRHGAIDDGAHVGVDRDRGDFLDFFGGFFLIIGEGGERKSYCTKQ